MHMSGWACILSHALCLINTIDASNDLQETGRWQRVRREGRFGTAGDRIRVTANYFRVMCTLAHAHHWDVNIVVAPRDGAPAPRRVAQKPLEAETCRYLILHYDKVCW